MSTMQLEHSEADYLFELGVNCATGRDRPMDIIAAHKWFNLAASIGHEQARKARTELALMMSGRQVSRAQKQARAWKKSH